MRTQKITIYNQDDTPVRDLNATVVVFNEGAVGITEYGFAQHVSEQYIFRDDLLPAPPRTAEELLKFQDEQELDIAYVTDIDGEIEYIDIMNGKSQQLTGKIEGFITLEAALNYIMDQAEGRV